MCECKNIDELMNEIASYRIQIKELKGRNQLLLDILKKKDKRIYELHDTIDNLARENEALRGRIRSLRKEKRPNQGTSRGSYGGLLILSRTFQ